MSNQFVFPKPKSWDTFEDIVCDVFSRKFNNRNFQRYGRGGQEQFGVDIAGVAENSLIGIQCKHHPTGKKISEIEIDEEVVKAESFYPPLNEFIIATSADRDTDITSYVIALSAKRESVGRFPVKIRFWEDIYGWLCDFPDVLYKYFTKYFPQSELQELKGLDFERNKVTSEWPTSEEELQQNINKTLREITRIDPYKITLGISTFTDVYYDTLVDLKVSLADCVSDKSPENGFLRAARILKDVKSILKPPFYSTELIVHLQSRLPYALLLGWMFRKVTGYDFKVYSSNQIWATSGFPLVFTHLEDSPPEMLNLDSKELVFSLNISRDINRQVNDFVSTWNEKPKAILSYRYLTSSRINAALGMSIALEISQRIKSFKDNWDIRKIHLFGAIPAGLAALIGHNLNSICPISIYYMNNTNHEFHIGGILTNDM